MYSIRSNVQNLICAMIAFGLFAVTGQMDYVDAQVQARINENIFNIDKNFSNQDAEYIANVCSGIWIDTDNLNPECPSLTEYPE